jgi:hypothetical protein
MLHDLYDILSYVSPYNICMSATTKSLSARIPAPLDRAIDSMAADSKKRKTDVVIELLQLGLTKREEENLADGFALLGDPAMQDMECPTGAQLEAARIAD